MVYVPNSLLYCCCYWPYECPNAHVKGILMDLPELTQRPGQQFCAHILHRCDTLSLNYYNTEMSVVVQ